MCHNLSLYPVGRRIFSAVTVSNIQIIFSHSLVRLRPDTALNFFTSKLVFCSFTQCFILEFIVPDFGSGSCFRPSLHTYKYFVSVSIHLLFLSMRRQFTANLITMLMALSTLTAVIVPIILFRNNFALNSICVTLFLPNCIRWDCHVEPCDGNEYNGKRETREKLERKLWKMKNNLISCIKRQQKWAVPMNEKSTNETDKAREPKKCKVISWWEKEKLGGIAKSNNKKMVV